MITLAGHLLGTPLNAIMWIALCTLIGCYLGIKLYRWPMKKLASLLLGIVALLVFLVDIFPVLLYR